MSEPRLITWSRDPRELVAGMRKRAELLALGHNDDTATHHGRRAVLHAAESLAWDAGLSALDASEVTP